MRIARRAYAKINWALDVLGQRDDGYHELDMLLETITLFDELVFESDSVLSLIVNGRPAPAGTKNLVIKAADKLMEITGRKRGARIHLTKRIPIRAGLGGGSSDCAAALLALNQLWRLEIPMRQLMEIGAQLGADVPFCMGTGLARVRGFGERLLRMQARRRIPLVLLHPGGGLGTPVVFRAWDEGGFTPLGIDMNGVQQALMQGDLHAVKTLSDNALEGPAIRLAPEIWEAREQLLAAGAVYAQMSGSGTAVFGAFPDIGLAREACRSLGRRAILAQTC